MIIQSAANDGVSGVGVFADGAALETYSSPKSPESPHVRSTRWRDLFD